MKRLALAALLLAACGGGDGARSISPPGGAYGDAPRISPDGTQLALIASPPGSSDMEQLVVMGLDGKNPRTLAMPASYLAAPAWSPDGTKIYFTSKDGVEVVAAGGGSATPVATGFNAFAAMELDVSPDGKTLAWKQNGGSLYTFDLANAAAMPVALATVGSAPRFSHDGTKLAFFHGDKYTLAILDLGSMQVTDLVAADTYLSSAAWFPDDTRIAYTAKGGIEVVTVADKSHHQIADAFAAKSLDLSADGKTIVYAVNGQKDIFVLTGF